MTFSNQQLVYIGLGAVLVGWYLKSRATAAVSDAAEAINPVNPNNVINGWFNDAYQATTGSDGTLGTDLADYFNGVDG